MEPEEISHATGLSPRLTKEYINLIHELSLDTTPALATTTNANTLPTDN
jgi:hypothetical protein